MIRQPGVSVLLVLSAMSCWLWSGCDSDDGAPVDDAPIESRSGAADSASARNGDAMRNPTAPAAPNAQAALPPGHPPIGGGAPPADPSAAGDLKFTPPAEWTALPPTSSMRKAQYVMPRAEGDDADGELVVYYFGPGQGGPIDANLERWRGQMTTADGAPLPDDAVSHETFEASGMNVTLQTCVGRFAPSPMMGAPSQSPRDGYRMDAAVVETDQGPWFFKATGPEKTMAHHADALRKMLKSCRR